MPAIFTTQKLLTFAQAEPEAVEATLGNVIAALLVMSAMAGSLLMIIIWWQRLAAGTDILPTATRKPLRIPPPLLIGGIVLSGMMALMVLLALLAALLPEGMLQEAANGDAAFAVVEEPDEATAETVTENEAAEAVDESVAEDDEAEKKAEKKAGMQAKFNTMLWQTLTINGIMFCVFGVSTCLAQTNHSRRSVSNADVRYPPFEAAAHQPFSAAQADPDTSDAEVDFLNDEDTFANPYAAANPYADTATNSQANPEPWSLTTELRFACETFLVAYLPTSILRILIVNILPDAPSHPFLEMLTEGVDWNIMALIAVMAVVVAPLVEELLYRVTVLGGLWQQNNLMIAWIVSSVLFSFAHGFPDSIALLPLAFAIGYTYIQRRSYRTVVMVHFLFNAFNMAIAGASML